MRMKLFELPNLPIGSPTQIAVAGVLQIHSADLLEATRRVEAGSQFIGERLIVNKAVCLCRTDGLFIEALGIELAALQTGDLGPDQRGAVLKIVRAIRRPHLELFVMRRKSLHVLLPLSGWRGIAGGGLRQCAIKLILRCFKM